MGLTETLAHFVAETSCDMVPEVVKRHAKERILDTIACMVGGVEEPPTKIALDFVRALGGNPVSTVAGHNYLTSAVNAALVNGVASHALEFDDSSAGGHISSVTLPAILAMAEETGASGEDVLLAFILSFEVETRLGLGLVQPLYDRGYHQVSALGSLGAAVGAAKVLKLDYHGVCLALGLGASFAGGIRGNVGTMTKRMHAGNGAKTGVMAAMLAARGYTASPNILDEIPGTGHNHFGYVEVFCGPGLANRERVIKDLGRQWELTPQRTTTKMHPGGTAHQVCIDITLELVQENDIKPHHVDRVEVGVTSFGYPGGGYLLPKNVDEARFSMPYHVAVCLLDRKTGPSQYASDERVNSSEVRELLEKVDYQLDPELEQKYQREAEETQLPIPMVGCDSKVAIFLKDGRVVSRQRKSTLGFPDNPATWDDLARKFYDCAEYSGFASKKVNLEDVLEALANLEQVPQAREFMAMLLG